MSVKVAPKTDEYYDNYNRIFGNKPKNKEPVKHEPININDEIEQCEEIENSESSKDWERSCAGWIRYTLQWVQLKSQISPIDFIINNKPKSTKQKIKEEHFRTKKEE